MQYYNTFYAPSIEVLTRNKDHTLSRVIMPKGEGKLTEDEHDTVMRSATIRAFITDGYLNFPKCPVLGPLYNKTREEREAREKILFNIEPEATDVTQDLAELTALVGSVTTELSEAKAANASLAAMNEAAIKREADLVKRLTALEQNSAKQPVAAPVVAKPAFATPAPKVETSEVAPSPIAMPKE